MSSSPSSLESMHSSDVRYIKTRKSTTSIRRVKSFTPIFYDRVHNSYWAFTAAVPSCRESVRVLTVAVDLTLSDDRSKHVSAQPSRQVLSCIRTLASPSLTHASRSMVLELLACHCRLEILMWSSRPAIVRLLAKALKPLLTRTLERPGKSMLLKSSVPIPGGTIR